MVGNIEGCRLRLLPRFGNMKKLLSVCLLACICSTAHAATLISESFESAFPPTGWTHVSVDQAATYAQTGTYSAKLGAAGDYLFTPPLTNAQTLTCWTYTTSANPGMIVEISSSASGPWIAVTGSPFSDTAEQWNKQTIPLASSKTHYVQFRKSGSGSLYIDTVLAENSSIPANTLPILAAVGDQSTTVSNALNFAVTATDIDNDPIILTASNLPPGAVFNTVTNAGTVSSMFSWTVAAPTGTYTPTFFVHDGTTNDSKTITITVTNAPALSDVPPILDPIGDKKAFEGDAVSFSVTASDPIDGNLITLTATDLPSGAIFTDETFTWRNAAPAGVYSVAFIATDKDGSDDETIDITITERPVLMITEVADPAGTGCGDYRFVELYNAGSTPIILDGGLWFLSKQVNGGSWSDTPLAGTLPAGETFVIAYSATKFHEAYGFAPDESNCAINGTGNDAYFLYSGGDHTKGTLMDIYGKFDTDGTDTAWEYTDSRVMRNATATGPNTTWTASEWIITDGATPEHMNPGTAYNAPPVLLPIGSRGGIEGGDISFSVTACDLADGDPFTLSATNLPTGAVFANGTFIWNTAAPLGVYSVTFIATDKDGSDSEIITITVTKRPELLISEIADPSGAGMDIYRFVELYNAGTNPINLTAGNWNLSRQNNGSSWYDIPLTGTIPAAGTYLIAKSCDDFFDAYEIYPQQENSNVDGNGNDSFSLYLGGDHSSGIFIDIYGEKDTDGTDTDWEYTDSQAERIETVLMPDTTWASSEWIITSGASTNDMTPGLHGPRPQFIDLDDVFIFLGDNLSLPVTAANTVRTDVITLSATDLPDGAAFPTEIGTDTVTSTLDWNSPTAGVYTINFQAEGFSGPRTESIQITVSSTTQVDGYFYGWENDTLVKLENGQFWQNTGGAGSTVDPRLRRPDVTITNRFGQTRMFVETVPNYTTVVLIDITESNADNTFNGLHKGNVYQLEDGTIWEQISFENISTTANPVTAWRWTDNGDTFIRFLDRYDLVIDTCKVIPAGEGVNPPITTQIDGYFRGWKNNRVFALTNGEFWQQITADNSIDTLYRPEVTLTNYLGTGTWRLYVNNAITPGYVEVQQLVDVTRTKIDGTFYGFGIGKFFKLQNGDWWRQSSLDTSASTRSTPEVLIWNESGTDIIEMPDEGRAVSAKQLAVAAENTVTNKFTGLHYANLYELADGHDWMQVSFKNISSSTTKPDVMLWIESGKTHLLVRDANDEMIGDCEIVNPDADNDGDQVANADEIIAGTDLYNEDDLFLITDIQYDSEGRAMLNWVPVEGRVYTIEWTQSLDEPFQTLEPDVIPNWIDTINPPGTGGFYRIRVQLEE